MFTKTYDQTINFLAESAPILDNPTKFIKWAEDMADVLHYIYNVEWDTITTDLVEATKQAQDYYDF